MFQKLITPVAILLACTTAYAENWAHWRGPTGNGSTTGKPPVSFSNKTNVKWSVEIPGASSGSPVVWNDRVFALTSILKKGLFPTIRG